MLVRPILVDEGSEPKPAVGFNVQIQTMKSDELRFNGHNVVDPFTSGICVLIGIYEMTCSGRGSQPKP